MLSKRWSVCAAAALLYGGAAAAQQPGTLLLGGFGQYTIFGNDLKSGGSLGTNISGNKVGYGGRIGAFITPNWDIEAEAAYTEAPTTRGTGAGTSLKYGPVAARLVYGLPIYGRSSILLGAGGVISPFHNDAGNAAGSGNLYWYKYGVTGDLGLRIVLGDYFAVRGDAIADYMPSSPSYHIFRFQGGLEVMPDFSSMMGMGSTAAGVSMWNDQPQPMPGTVELKGFGQYTRYASGVGFDRGFRNGLGYGGGLGVFLTPNIEVEGDGVYTQPKTLGPTGTGGTTGASGTFIQSQAGGIGYDQANFALRANYNFPLGPRNSFIIGAGAVRSSYHRSDNAAGPLNTYAFGPEGLVGFRLGLANRIALRVDGIVDYPLGDLKVYNYSGRAGLSFMLGGASRATVDTTPVAVTPPPPPPPPAPVEPPPPPPPPAPVAVDTTKITAPLYFDFDRSDLRSDAQSTLDAKIPYLTANPGMRIRIEGNTDERGSDEYNLALGQRRAASAKQYLVGHAIDAGRIDIVSYGEERPVCKEHNESCWQQNRRDDFRILVIGSDAIKAPQ